MEPLTTTYRVRGETVTVVTEPLRTRKQTNAEHTKRCKLAVQTLYSNAAPAWLAELDAEAKQRPSDSSRRCYGTGVALYHYGVATLARQVERTARGSFTTHTRFLPGFSTMVKTRWADAKA